MIYLAPANTEVYSSHQYLKKKLQGKHRETISFTQISSKSDVLCFRDTASEIIRKCWDKRKETDELRSLVATAAKILISELRSKTDFDVSHYRNSSDTENVKKKQVMVTRIIEYLWKC